MPDRTSAVPALGLAVPGYAKPLIAALAMLASVSLAYGCRNAFRDGADLERRAEEADLFRRHINPYSDEDATYPPPALPLFAATVSSEMLVRRAMWLAFNLLAMAAVARYAIPEGRRWPPWLAIAFALIVVAAKPSRAGVSLGQFHLIPLAMMLASERLARRTSVGSAVLATVALAKPTMSLPFLLVLAVQRRWRLIAEFAVLEAALVLFTSIWLGVGPIRLMRDWLHNAGSQVAQGTVDLPTLALRLDPRLNPWVPAITGTVLLATGVILYAWRDRSTLGLMATAGFAAAIMSYHRHYDLVLVLPAVAYLIDDALVRGHRLSSWAGCTFAALLIVPSDGRLIGRTAERIYDLGFVVATYVTLGVLLYTVWREPRKNTDDPGLT